MKLSIGTRQVTVLMAVLTTGVAMARDGELRLGATPELVRDVLGAPSGYIRMGTSELWRYERGKVRFENGKVTFIDLVSKAEALERREARERRRKELAAERRHRLQQRRAEGLNLRESSQDDPEYLSMSAAGKVNYWEAFRSRYPSVDVDHLHAEALEALQKELEVRELRARTAALEQRVEEAEARARRAERQACLSPRVSMVVSSGYGWPTRTWSHGNRHARYRHLPFTIKTRPRQVHTDSWPKRCRADRHVNTARHQGDPSGSKPKVHTETVNTPVIGSIRASNLKRLAQQVSHARRSR